MTRFLGVKMKKTFSRSRLFIRCFEDGKKKMGKIFFFFKQMKNG